MGFLIVIPSMHKGYRRIMFQYDFKPGSELDTLVRSLPGRQYSSSKRMWHIAFRPDYKEYLAQVFGGIENISVAFKANDKGHAVVNSERDSLTQKTEDDAQQSIQSVEGKTVKDTSTSAGEEILQGKKVLLLIDKSNKRFFLKHAYDRFLFDLLASTQKGFWISRPETACCFFWFIMPIYHWKLFRSSPETVWIFLRENYVYRVRIRNLQPVSKSLF